MIPIYICDDHPVMLQQIEQQIKNSCMIEALDFRVAFTTPQPKRLLEELHTQPVRGIYFLDIDLANESMNGFQLGKKIRQLDPTGFLIYVTTHHELLPETFRYRLAALDYILKDDPETMGQNIRSALLTVQQLLADEQVEPGEVFTVETASKIFHIPVQDIHYFETTHKKHTIALITSDEYIEFYGNLAQLTEHFAEAFIRTHQSYLVNKTHIKSIDKKERILILRNGNHCLVARNKMKELKHLGF